MAMLNNQRVYPKIAKHGDTRYPWRPWWSILPCPIPSTAIKTARLGGQNRWITVVTKEAWKDFSSHLSAATMIDDVVKRASFFADLKIQQIPRLFNSFYCLVDIGHNPPSSSPAAPHEASSLYHILCFCCLDSHVSWNHYLCLWSHACSGQSRWMTGGDVLLCHVWPGSSHSNPLFLMKDMCYFDYVFFRDFPGVFSVFSALFCLALQKKSYHKLYPSGSLRFPQTSDISIVDVPSELKLHGLGIFLPHFTGIPLRLPLRPVFGCSAITRHGRMSERRQTQLVAETVATSVTSPRYQ